MPENPAREFRLIAFHPPGGVAAGIGPYRLEENDVRIAWLAAVQPPYRESMWKEVAAAADLTVSFFRREEKVRHFTWADSPHYRSAVVRSLRVPLPRAVAERFDEPVVVLNPGVARRMLRGADALVIHVWWQPANFWTAVRGRIMGIPYVIYAESTLESRQYTRGPMASMRTMIFKHAGAVIVPGPAAATAAIADGTPPSRVVESCNSVDFELFDREVREIRSTVPDGDAIHRFVCIGQLIDRKNLRSLIRAFSAIGGNSMLEIAGDGVDMPALKALARETGVEERVLFHGFLAPTEVLHLLSRTHTLVLPSTEEVYGYTALEAYVAGLQVIVSERAGIAANLAGRPGTWVVDPGEGGLRRVLEEAQHAWTGWRGNDDLDFASPRRAALGILRAVEIAQSTRRSRTRYRKSLL